MAITTYNEPSGYPSVQDSLWHAAISDASGLTNFKYVFDVYDTNGNQLIRSKVYPDVNDGWGYFDAGSVVRNEVDFSWFEVIDSGILIKNLQSGQNEISYTVKVGEEYNIAASGITNLAQATGTITAYNFFPGLFDRRQIDVSLFDTKYYTNRPKGFLPPYSSLSLDSRCRYGYTSWGEDFLVGLNDSGSVSVVVKKYSQYNVLLSTNSKSINMGAAQIKQLNIGMKAINSEFSSSIFSIADTDGYYVVIIGDQAFMLNIKCHGESTPINLYFMNAFGVFDTARFNCTNKLSMMDTRKKYSRKEVIFSGGEVKYFTNNGGKNVFNETAINYAQDLAWTYKLMMDFPTDDEWEWLAELVFSPQIYMAINDQYYPVTIKNTNYDYNKQLWAKLKTFELEIEVNQKRQGFRR